MKREIIIGLIAALAVVVFMTTRADRPLPIKKLDPWILQTNDPNNGFGTYLGNGVIGTHIGEEGTCRVKGESMPTLMAGLYENEKYVTLPDWGKLEAYGPSRIYYIDEKAPYRQTLNMREGYVQTEYTLKAYWMRLKVNATTFVLRKSTFPGQLIAVRYEIIPNLSGEMMFGDPDLGDAHKNGWEHSYANDLEIISRSKPTGVAMAIGNLTDGKSWKPSYQKVRLRRGVPLVLTKLVAISRAEGGTAKNAELSAFRTVNMAKYVGFDKLFDEHKQAWRDLWKSDIVIEGDPKAQQAVHACMFYLLASAGTEPNSIQPLGLSSNAYWNGHIFWDADIWMYPSLLAQHPDLARSIVDYRYATLPSAMENAKKHGMTGAEYAWESAATGLETIAEPFCRERHITSDVAIAQWNYFLSTQDKNWLEERGWPVISACANYWASKAKYNAAKDRYEILDVVPPDENAGVINNSAYTNASAKRTLEIAAVAAAKVGKPANPKWAAMAGKMYIPFDASNKRFIEHDGFAASSTKQADVELMIYPLCLGMPDDVRTASFDFYKAKVQKNGPAMSASVHSVISAELGRRDDAYSDFIASYEPFLRGPFLMFNEKRSDTWHNRCFLTGCGGTLQSVLYGFGGFRIGAQPNGFNEILPELYIKPCLPKSWRKLEIRNLQWQGKRYDLIVRAGDKWELRPLN